MSTIKKTDIKKVSIILLILLVLPLISVLIDVISSYGNYVGSQARIFIEEGISR